MEKDIRIEFLRMIQSAVSKTRLPLTIDADEAEELYRLSQLHNMAHLVGYTVSKNGVCTNERWDSKFIHAYYQAIRHMTNQEVELERVRVALCKNNIDFLPLKGPIISKYYPERWMRLSSDLDILVKEKDVEKVSHILVDELGYTKRQSEVHDVPLISPSGSLLELHFSLSKREGDAKELLDDVWNNSYLLQNSNHEYCMSEEFYYFYHIFHAAKHFQLGGCGVRTVLDTWLLNQHIHFNQDLRESLLKKSGLLLFAEKLEEIADKWFSGKGIDNLDEVEEYIISGGVFGKKQKIEATQAVEGGRRNFVLSRLFPSVQRLKTTYPVLKKAPFLLPVFWVYRLIKGVFSGKAKYELEKSKESEHRSEKIAKMFGRLGLGNDR